MKKIFTLFFSAALISNFAMAQAPIPNGDFENWNASGALDPSGWSSTDDIVVGLGLGLNNPAQVVQETTPANVYSGSSAALLTTKAITIPTLGGVTFAGAMILGHYGFTLANFQLTTGGTAYTDRPDSIEFAYMYNLPVGAIDSGVVKVNLTKATVNDGTIPIGSATIYLNYTSTYTIAKAKIDYVSAQSPDSVKIQAQSSAAFFMKGANGAQLWIDAMQFVGIDSTFKVYLTPNSSQSKCVGDTISIRTDDIAGDTYTWFLNNTQLPDTTYKIRTGTAGNYSLLVSHNGGLYVSDTISLTVNPLPVVTLTGPQDTLCNNGATVTLSGGSPAGGNYSGRGVAGGNLNPANAPLGNATVRYTYTDNNGCRATAIDTALFYIAGCSLGIGDIQSESSVSIYPNPASNVVFINGTNDMRGGTASLYDVQGRLINTLAVNGTQVSMNLSAVSAGWYTVVITGADNVSLAKAKIVVAK